MADDVEAKAELSFEIQDLGTLHAKEETNATKEPASPIEPAFAQNRSFFISLLAALGTGGLLGLLCVGYLKLIKVVPEHMFEANNDSFPDDPSTLWFAAGKPWWIAVGAATGLVTGVIKAATNMDAYPSILMEMQEKHVDPWMSFRVMILCLISILGGAPVGPEAGLGSIGMLIGQSSAHFIQRFLPSLAEGVDPKELTMVGAAAALSPVVPSPILAVVLCGEVGGWPTSRQAALYLAGATASFAVYWSINEKTYISPVALTFGGELAREISAYDFAIAILFGAMGSVMALCYFLIAGIVQALFGRIKQKLDTRAGERVRILVLCTLSGTMFGIINYVFPLATGSGEMIISSAITNADLHTGLLIASTAAKALSYWICNAGGLVGGLMLPILAMGTMVGSAVAEWTGVNRVLALTSSFVALAAAFCPIPVFLVLLAYVVFPVSQLVLFTIFVTVYTSYLLFVGTGVPQFFMERAKRKAAQAAQ